MPESPYADLDRPPLRADALTRALVRPGGLWCEVRVVAETGSTNADLVTAARAGAPEGTVLVAESQTAGRGRLGRSWSSPARAALTFSVLLRPAVVPVRRGWLPLLTGVAVAAVLRRVCGVDARLKWPNDVLVGERKLAGILAEQEGAAIVVGVGLNVTTRPDELPVPTATSLVIEGAVCADRDTLLRAVLRELAEWYGRWRAAQGDADACGLRQAYREASATLGREVRVELPADRRLDGRAVDVDADGRLVVAAGEVERAVSAGDVVHVR